MNAFRKYIVLGKVSLQNAMAYRSTFLISLLAGFVLVMSQFYIWKAIYSKHNEIGGYSWDEMKAYLLIMFITNSLLSWYSEMAISQKILDGSVAMDLLKPLDFQKARLAETMGASIFESILGAALASIIIIIFEGIASPPDLLTWLLFLVSLLASALIKFGIIYIAGLFCFWTSNPYGVAWVRAAITNLLSGAIVPLTLFPRWLESVTAYLPFRGVVFVPASIFLNRINGQAAVQEIAIQLLWALFLWLAGRMIWSRAVRQITIYGG
ncbi:ABC-2 type transport system permease protein [Paenibacillus forsythiae]|uniref:ABC-2 type transport system permease protein n=1 Tax=Paenibacillus forsythiae TaxID=365616 RepID=A0ABU3HAA9_9BACL|nr:ABC-2 family transporter protein [Paenibacillus forsythiae]MDT3427768.1 ABC-2 type transport system permease protein [Paenibacillus forsythiae]